MTGLTSPVGADGAERRQYPVRALGLADIAPRCLGHRDREANAALDHRNLVRRDLEDPKLRGDGQRACGE